MNPGDDRGRGAAVVARLLATGCGADVGQTSYTVPTTGMKPPPPGGQQIEVDALA